MTVMRDALRRAGLIDEQKVAAEEQRLRTLVAAEEHRRIAMRLHIEDTDHPQSARGVTLRQRRVGTLGKSS
jgi:hypothetical protein